MSRSTSVGWRVVAAGLLVAGLSASAWADDQDRTRDRDLLQLRDQIHKDTNLSPQELDALGPELKQYLLQKGSGEQVRAMIQTALQNNCKATCLGETIRTMNRAMTQGVSDQEAQNMVSNALRDQIRERDQKRLTLTDQELGDKVRAQVQERLATMEQEKTREREQAERRDMDRGLGSPGAGPGGAKGGGR